MVQRLVPLSFSLLLHVFCLISLVEQASSYSWQFTSTPSQCGKISVSIEGGDGHPPYNMLIIPYGSSPIANEVRQLITITFNGTGDKLQTDDGWKLSYPGNSEFIAVFSDQNHFASGGTSAPWTVKESADGSCFDASQAVHPKWPFFYINPEGLRSCESNRVYWNSSNPNITGTPNFIGVIPSGVSFNISASSGPYFDTFEPTSGKNTTGFNWQVPVNPGTDLILVSGDQGSTGAGGSVEYKVSPPQDPAHTACVPNMPSQTAGIPAGGNPSLDLKDDGDVHSHLGAIIGGAVGGAIIVCIIFVIVFLLRRRNRRRRPGAFDIDPKLSPMPPYSEHEVTPFQYDQSQYHSVPSHSPNQGMPYSPMGFPGSAHSAGSGSGGGYSDMGSPPSSASPLPLSTANPSSSMPLTPVRRKSQLAHQQYPQRPVNIVRHTDAEDVHDQAVETVELPPAYSHNRRPRTSDSGVSSSGAGTMMTAPPGIPSQSPSQHEPTNWGSKTR